MSNPAKITIVKAHEPGTQYIYSENGIPIVPMAPPVIVSGKLMSPPPVVNNTQEPDIHYTDVESDIPVVPMAPPVIVSGTVTTSSKVWTNADFVNLKQQGYPLGLAQELMDSTTKKFPIRFWIVDNSGSMDTNDGITFLETSPTEDVLMFTCTRWQELQSTIGYHAQLAGLVQATTLFRLLNDPGQACGSQMFSVNERGPALIDSDVAAAQSCMDLAKPDGYTPLAMHIDAVRKRIEGMAPTLRREGKKAVVVLATDGMPTTEDGTEDKSGFIQSLRSLQALPVWIIVRLCTGESSVVDFYNNMDSQLEAPIDVIDDFFGEANEICKVNNWLNYALPLHRSREFGARSRLFDLLDERRFTKDELFEFVVLLFGKAAFQNAPNIHADWNGFLKALSRVVANEERRWNPVTKKHEPWIDINRLVKFYGSG